MKFSIDKQVLAKIAANAKAIAGEGIRAVFNARGTKLEVTASDYDMVVMQTAEIETDENGECTFPTKKLSEIASSASVGKVHIETKDGALHIKAGRSKWKLLPVDEGVPVAPQKVSSCGSIEVQGADLYAAIESTIGTVSNDGSRSQLGGICFEPKKNGLRLVSTDGHRLSRFDIDATSTLKQTGIVSKKTAHMLNKLLAGQDKTGDVAIALNDHAIEVTGEGWKLTAPLIAGDFPDYVGMIPKNNETSPEVNASAFHAALNRASILSTDKGVCVVADKGNLSIKAHSVHGTSSEKIDASYAGKKVTAWYNAEYLLHALKFAHSSVVLEIDSFSPMSIRPKEAGAYLALVMPMDSHAMPALEEPVQEAEA